MNKNILHCIIVLSNPCSYKRRVQLFKEFLDRVDDYPDTVWYVVELCYGDQEFTVSDSDNINHLQLRSDTPIWHKENLINIAIDVLLPFDWEYCAWVDADLKFENKNLAIDAIKLLENDADIIQLWKTCDDLDSDMSVMKKHKSACNQLSKGQSWTNNSSFHPGYAWAFNRKTYEKIDGLFEVGILGSGDHIMLQCLLGHPERSINEKSSENYKEFCNEYADKCKGLRLGYVDGNILHYFHGSKQNRHYNDRYQILLKHNYSPFEHLQVDYLGLLYFKGSKEFSDDIFEYFKMRKEDD